MRLTGSEQLGHGYLEVRWGWGSGSEQLFGGGLVFIYSITCELASGVCAGIHTPTGLRFNKVPPSQNCRCPRTNRT